MKIVRGSHKTETGKVTAVYRKKWVIYIERITRDKVNGATAQVPFDPSKVRRARPLCRALFRGRRLGWWVPAVL